MNDDLSNKNFLDFQVGSLGQCPHCTNTSAAQIGVTDDDAPIISVPAGISFANKDWRRHCIAQKAVMPAGYTYLGQLIGHDSGDSRDLGHIPHVPNYETSTTEPDGCEDGGYAVQKDAQTSAIGRSNGRYNIIENPLSFETLYGSGPSTLHHVFDPVTMLFRTTKWPRLALQLSTKHPYVYALYDVRNRDNLMIHQLSVMWMHYHNHIALSIRGDLKQRAKEVQGLASKVYVRARRHVLAAWHNVIEQDYMRHILHPYVFAMTPDEIGAFKPVDETTLQHGVFRAFHSMPRGVYHVPAAQKLPDLLARLPDISKAEETDWMVDLEQMFDFADDKGDKAGISASVTEHLAQLLKRDLKTSREVHPQGLGSDSIEITIAGMDMAWQNKLRSEALSAEFTAQIQPVTGAVLSATDLIRMPIHLVLMIEAHLYGEDGGLGPLGSVLMRRAISEKIGALVYGRDTVDDDFSAPKSMIEIIKILKEKENEQ